MIKNVNNLARSFIFLLGRVIKNNNYNVYLIYQLINNLRLPKISCKCAKNEIH